MLRDKRGEVQGMATNEVSAERKAAFEAAVSAVTKAHTSGGFDDPGFAALRRFGESERRAAEDGARPLFVSFVERVGTSGAVALSAGGSFFSARAQEAATMVNRGQPGGRILVENLRRAHDAAVASVATRWRESARDFSNDLVPVEAIDRVARGMATLVGDGAELRGSQRESAMTAFLTALYPASAPVEQARAADGAIARLFALQSRESGRPFTCALDAHDVRAEAITRSPRLELLIDEAIRDDLSATLRMDNSEAAPVRVEPKIRESGGKTHKIWVMASSGGGPVCGRDPFDGPAAEAFDRATGETRSSFLWAGRPLGHSLADAVERMRDEFPRELEACAARFAAEMATLAKDNPAAHAERIAEMVRELGELGIESLPPAARECLLQGDYSPP